MIPKTKKVKYFLLLLRVITLLFILYSFCFFVNYLLIDKYWIEVYTDKEVLEFPKKYVESHFDVILSMTKIIIIYFFLVLIGLTIKNKS